MPLVSELPESVLLQHLRLVPSARYFGTVGRFDRIGDVLIEIGFTEIDIWNREVLGCPAKIAALLTLGV